MNDNRPIGIFDSGVGGLNVAQQIKKLLPNERIIYYGDTKHLPYGDKSKENIIQFAENITRYLLERDCKLIVIACNSAASNALKEVKQLAEGRAPVVDVIHPVADKVAYQLHQKVGVIATKATVSSGIYKKQIRKKNKHLKVVEFATPLLVPIIEEGLSDTPISKATIAHYLSNKRLEGMDSLILGCTHYPIISREIRQYLENKVDVLDTPLIVANHLLHFLEKKGLKSAELSGEDEFYFSDYTKNFSRLAKKFFGHSIQLEHLDVHH